MRPRRPATPRSPCKETAEIHFTDPNLAAFGLRIAFEAKAHVGHGHGDGHSLAAPLAPASTTAAMFISLQAQRGDED